MKKRSSTITSVDVFRLIQDARNAELCRNLVLFRQILSSFWSDIDCEPDVSVFQPQVQPELLRLCGVYLSQYGRARALGAYQVRAKDLLTRATRFFEEENLPDKAAETKVSLANCFWFSGEITEYDDILQSIENEFRTEPSHSVSIQIKLNKIFVAIWRGNSREAKQLVGQVANIISSDHDFRLRTQFHNLAGMAYRALGDYTDSIAHTNEAVRIARSNGNHIFLAMSLNNLAFVYRVAGRFDKALKTSEEAIAITEASGDKGWTAHFLDTKALIYLDQAEYDKALETIDRSIDIFREGEDFTGLTDAMWTKCLCLLRLDRFTDMLPVFVELKDIASRQIGQIAVDKFEELLLKEIHILRHFPLTDELAALKRTLVIRAMRENNCHVSKASRALGLRSQQHLSDILNNQFPDIYDELGIERRSRRLKSAAAKETAPLGVTRLIMPKDRTYTFSFAIRGKEEPQFFYFPRDIMRELGVRTDAVVAVMPVHSNALQPGAPVLYFHNEAFRIGRLSFDRFTDLFLVDLENFVFLSDVQLIGVPVGYCPAADRNKRVMRFKPLETDEGSAE